jgi:hypothetical protein
MRGVQRIALTEIANRPHRVRVRSANPAGSPVLTRPVRLNKQTLCRAISLSPYKVKRLRPFVRFAAGRMFIIEIFARGCQPKHRPTPPSAVIRIDTS